MRRKHLILTNGTVVADKLIPNGTVVTLGSRIIYVGDEEEGAKIKDAAIPGVFEIIDAQGGYIAPGFIDVHMHGSAGCELMDGTEEALRTMARYLPKSGTVAFLPSTVTAAPEITRSVARLVADYAGSEDEAEVLGIHLEGPYINERYKGAQYGPAIRPADVSELEDLYSILGEKLRLVTLAPEVPGSLEAIAWLKARGVKVSIGHSDATYEEAVRGFEAGITHATHTYNGMRSASQRAGSAGGCSGHTGYLDRTDRGLGSRASRRHQGITALRRRGADSPYHRCCAGNWTAGWRIYAG